MPDPISKLAGVRSTAEGGWSSCSRDGLGQRTYLRQPGKRGIVVGGPGRGVTSNRWPWPEGRPTRGGRALGTGATHLQGAPPPEEVAVDGSRRLTQTVPETAELLGVYRAFAYTLIGGRTSELQFSRVVVPRLAIDHAPLRACLRTQGRDRKGGRHRPASIRRGPSGLRCRTSSTSLTDSTPVTVPFAKIGGWSPRTASMAIWTGRRGAPA